MLQDQVACYAQSDRETMRAVVNGPRKLLAMDLERSQLATREPWSPPGGQCSRRRTSPGMEATGRRTTGRVSSDMRLGVVRGTVPRLARSSAKVAPPPRK